MADYPGPAILEGVGWREARRRWWVPQARQWRPELVDAACQSRLGVAAQSWAAQRDASDPARSATSICALRFDVLAGRISPADGERAAVGGRWAQTVTIDPFVLADVRARRIVGASAGDVDEMALRLLSEVLAGVELVTETALTDAARRYVTACWLPALRGWSRTPRTRHGVVSMTEVERRADRASLDGWGAAPAGVNAVQRRAARRLLLGEVATTGALGWRAAGRPWEEAVDERGLVGRWTCAAYFCDPANASREDVEAERKRIYQRTEYRAGQRRARRLRARAMDADVTTQLGLAV